MAPTDDDAEGICSHSSGCRKAGVTPSSLPCLVMETPDEYACRARPYWTACGQEFQGNGECRYQGTDAADGFSRSERGRKVHCLRVSFRTFPERASSSLGQAWARAGIEDAWTDRTDHDRDQVPRTSHGPQEPTDHPSPGNRGEKRKTPCQKGMVAVPSQGPGQTVSVHGVRKRGGKGRLWRSARRTGAARRGSAAGISPVCRRMNRDVNPRSARTSSSAEPVGEPRQRHPIPLRTTS